MWVHTDSEVVLEDIDKNSSTNQVETQQITKQ